MKEKILHLTEEQLADYEARLIAKGKNLKRYPTTLTCKNGHCSTRITTTTHCYECFTNSPPKTQKPTPSVTHINPKTYTQEYLQLLIAQAQR